jgi:FtsH-binding integral membrane protein
MSTVVARPASVQTSPTTLPGRRYDRQFFSGTAWLMLLTVFVGFGPTYYWAGMYRAPLPSRIIHIHGAIFSCWILLLITQTALVSMKRVDLHRRLGFAGFVLACAMVVAGLLAATDTLVRGKGIAGRDVQFFYLIPVSDIIVFGTLIAFAFRNRKNSASHKRFIYIATSGILIAAIARWPLAYLYHNPLHASYVVFAFLALLLAYDWWSTRTVRRDTLWASMFLVFVYLVRIPIAASAGWHAIAARIQDLAR